MHEFQNAWVEISLQHCRYCKHRTKTTNYTLIQIRQKECKVRTTGSNRTRMWPVLHDCHSSWYTIRTRCLNQVITISYHFEIFNSYNSQLQVACQGSSMESKQQIINPTSTLEDTRSLARNESQKPKGNENGTELPLKLPVVSAIWIKRHTARLNISHRFLGWIQ